MRIPKSLVSAVETYKYYYYQCVVSAKTFANENFHKQRLLLRQLYRPQTVHMYE